MRSIAWLPFLLLVSGVPTPLFAEVEADGSLARQAYEILQNRCSRCHGQAADQAGLDVLSRENLLQPRGRQGSEFFFVVPGKPERSQLVDAIQGGSDSYMPQGGSPEAQAMTDEEKELLKRWVAAGAPFPRREQRDFLTDKQVLTALRDFLEQAAAEDRPHLRFYSLAHLQNNPEVTELDLRLYRAALAKAINSLSQEPEVYLPQPVPNASDAVFAIDLRRLGWDRRNLWNEILKQYPYGLKFDFVKDEELQELAKEVGRLTGADLPCLRADWFIVTATRPPLYHTLLDIPKTLKELEERLKLDIQQNVLDGKIQRSGYAKSGVSKQNRMIERHVPKGSPYFWISYDFLPNRARGDLTRFPLGPAFSENPFSNQAFEHDGGELIWSLPNGMQGYMLVDGQGSRIDAGPIEVVFDRSAILGTPSIINGISCMYCHRDGMITEFRDEIRLAEGVGGEAANKVREVYIPVDQMQQAIQEDQKLFLQALEKVIGPYLQVGSDAEKPISQFPEPIGKVAEMYSRDLKAHEVALELGIEKVELLQAKIEGNRGLLRFGLGALAQDPPATLKREKWETRDGTSLMQEVARELRVGLPFLP